MIGTTITDLLGWFSSVAVSFIADFSYRFCCFVFDVKQIFKVKFVVYYVMTKMDANE